MKNFLKLINILVITKIPQSKLVKKRPVTNDGKNKIQKILLDISKNLFIIK